MTIRPASSPRVVMGVAVLATSMAFLDITALNVALPSLQSDLPATSVQLLWVLNAYALPLTALLLLAGSVSDRYGRRRVFGAGIALFAAASLGCGLAPSAAVMIAMRAVQGLGAAMMIPGSLALITAAYPPQRRGRAIGVWSACGALTMALGPVLGGLLAGWGLWRGVFFMNVPLAAVALWLLVRLPKASYRSGDEPIDWLGAALASIGLAGVSFAGLQGPRRGMDEPAIIGATAVGAAALIGFVMVEARSRRPMLPLRLFRSRPFAVACGLTIVLYTVFHAVTVLLPMNLVRAQGYTPAAAGVALLPVVLLIVALAPVSGWMADRAGPRRPLLLGSASAALGLAMFALAGVTSGPNQYVQRFLLPCALLGAGIGMTIAPLSTMVMNAVSDEQIGFGSAINSTVARLAGLLAVALLGVLWLNVFPQSLERRAAPLPAPLRRALLAEAPTLADAGASKGAAVLADPAARAATRWALADTFTAFAWTSAGAVLLSGATAVLLLKSGPCPLPVSAAAPSPVGAVASRSAGAA